MAKQPKIAVRRVGRRNSFHVGERSARALVGTGKFEFASEPEEVLAETPEPFPVEDPPAEVVEPPAPEPEDTPLPVEPSDPEPEPVELAPETQEAEPEADAEISPLTGKPKRRYRRRDMQAETEVE